MTDASALAWREIHWQRPLDVARVVGCLRQWAADQRSPRITLEVRASASGASYLLGTHPAALLQVAAPLRSFLGATVLKTRLDREPVTMVRRLQINTDHRPLRMDEPEGIVRATLAAMAHVQRGELLVLQVVLGPRRVPLAVPNQSPSSVVAPLWEVAWRGDGGQIDGEKRTALRAKVADHGFACTIRLGADAATADRRRALLLGLLAALRTSEAAGAHLRLLPDWPRGLNDASRAVVVAAQARCRRAGRLDRLAVGR